ncbi:MAG: succinate dehydrogenase assembly factor 2 [Pseudomonadales bacterium]
MASDVEARRVYWHSRRGMLELDLILVPFVEQQYSSLDEADQQAYRALLECEDTDIYAWMMQRSEPDEESLRPIVQRIVQHATTHRGAP